MRADTVWAINVVVVLIVVFALGQVQAATAQHRLSGTFLQIDAGIARWNERVWAQELDWMQEAGMDLIIVQYSGYGDAWWYPRPGHSGTRDVLGTLLFLAEQRGMQVMLGLHLSPDYWEGTHDMEADLVRNKEVAEQLHDLYGASPAFAGWYIPHELSDLTFANDTQFRAAKMLGGALVAHLRALTPDKPIGIAPYFGKYLYPREYELKWAEFLNDVPVDIIMLQDGVGTHRVGLDDIVPYFRALLRAIGDRPIALWSDLEIFDQTHGWPVNDRPWAATTAPIDRIVSQMELAGPYVERIVVFEFSHYMSPRLPHGKSLFDAYVNLLSR